MLVALWIVNVLTGLMSAMSGVMKLTMSREKQLERLPFAADFTVSQVRLIGAAEALALVGLVLPLALKGALPGLVVVAPLAAVCLGVLMIGAVSVHLRREEAWFGPLPLLVLAVASAVLGFLYVAR